MYVIIFFMRVVAGKYGGRPLKTLDGKTTVTRLMPRTSLMIRDDTFFSNAYGSSAQSAVMKSLVCPIARLISHFTKFPGVGNKSARRMVFYLLKQDAAQLRELGAGIASLKDDLHTCSECGNISNRDPCDRDRKSVV